MIQCQLLARHGIGRVARFSDFFRFLDTIAVALAQPDCRRRPLTFVGDRNRMYLKLLAPDCLHYGSRSNQLIHMRIRAVMGGLALSISRIWR